MKLASHFIFILHTDVNNLYFVLSPVEKKGYYMFKKGIIPMKLIRKIFADFVKSAKINKHSSDIGD